jgi:hypothetical protein
MKLRQSSMCVAVACTLAAGVSAQTTPLTGGASQPTFGAEKKVTVTGCLERSSQSVATNDRFVLNNVVPSGPAAADTVGTSGSEKPLKATSYRLDAEDSKLSPHVGHKIEITGTVEQRPKSAAATPRPTGSTGSTPEAEKFTVEAVKMIASSCTV